MKSETLQVRQTDGHITNIDYYTSTSKKYGSILVLHGMAEHYERYDTFATFLANHGYDVYLYSQRGHGTHLQEHELGFFAEKNGYQLVVNDAIEVLKTIRKREASLPLFLMGHSMGSLITRNVIQEYNQLDGIIICGTANPPSITTMGGLVISTLSGYRKYPRKRAPFIDKVMFGSSLYKKLNKRTNSDWLCTDEAEVDQYIKDPYCGFICTKSFYHDLLMLTKHATDKKRILRTNSSIPLFILSGNQDPVGGYGKDVARLIEFYKQHGYQVTSKLYDGLRHELLNEPCKLDIMQDILNFLNKTQTTLQNSTEYISQCQVPSDDKDDSSIDIGYKITPTQRVAPII